MSNALAKKEKTNKILKDKFLSETVISIPTVGMFLLLKDIQSRMTEKLVLAPEWKEDDFAPVFDKLVEENVAVWETDTNG